VGPKPPTLADAPVSGAFLPGGLRLVLQPARLPPARQNRALICRQPPVCRRSVGATGYDQAPLFNQAEYGPTAGL
jgi:hypothetical protein